MAGVLWPNFGLAKRPGDATDGATRTDPGGFARKMLDSVVGGCGSHARKSPQVTIVADTHVGGAIQASYVSDFYHRIHFIPNRFSYGFITEDAARKVTLWNAFLTETTVEALSIPEGLGLALTQAPSLPYLMNAIGVTDLIVRASVEGPQAFDVVLTAEFSQGPDLLVPISGERVSPIEYGPNWKDPMTEVLTFKTEVVNVSRTGKEQRRALRQEPRRDFSYTLSVHGRGRRSLDGLLARWRRRPGYTDLGPYRRILVVMDPYRVKLAETVTAAGVTLPLTEDAPAWLIPGQQVYLRHRDLRANRVATVAGVTGSTLTLAVGVPIDLPADTHVVLMVPARLKDGTEVVRATDDYQDATIGLEVTPGADALYVPPPAPETFDGYELFMTKPNWSRALTVAWDHPLDEVDFGWGVPGFSEVVDFASYTVKQQYLVQRDASLQLLKDFFLRMKGQRGEFYAPTWGDDIRPKLDLESGETKIRVNSTDLYLDYHAQTTHRALVIFLADGSRLLRKVVSISSVSDATGTDSIITVNTPWTAGVPVSEITKISWLMRCRLATDTLRIEWETDRTATVQMAHKVLEVLA